MEKVEAGMIETTFARILGRFKTIESKSNLDPQGIGLSEPDDMELLKHQLIELEYELGKRIVHEQRRYSRKRLKTIARFHLNSSDRKTKSEWLCEAKALVLYFQSAKENDSKVAHEMLMPFEARYLECRARALDAKPTVGQGRQME